MAATRSLTRRDALRIAGHSTAALALSGIALGDDPTDGRTFPAVPGELAVSLRRRLKAGFGIQSVEKTA
ncbi:MAG: hypothetical protein ACKVHE_33280 [Planctomycetales bacterium]|jgi:hypothetical protein